MTRTFVNVSHTGKPDGDWNLNDLTAGAGRVDVLCRNIQSAFFLSHGLRDDVQFYAIFTQAAPRAKVVHLDSGKIQRLNPDERSTAARLQQALVDKWNVPDWKEVQGGIRVGRLGLDDVLDELAPKGTLVLLDPEGTPLQDWAPPKDPVFVLSDHVPFTAQEYASLGARNVQRVSLGPHWYHGNNAIAVIHWWLDQTKSPQVR